MPCFKKIIDRTTDAIIEEHHDTNLGELVLNFEPKTAQDRIIFSLRCEYIIHEMRQRMAHADFKEKRSLSQQLEFYELKYYEIGGKRWVPRKRSFQGLRALMRK